MKKYKKNPLQENIFEEYEKITKGSGLEQVSKVMVQFGERSYSEDHKDKWHRGIGRIRKDFTQASTRTTGKARNSLGGRAEEVALIARSFKETRWKNGLEIGVGWGISTIWFANNLLLRKDLEETFFQTIDKYYLNGEKKYSMSKMRHENIKKLQEIIPINWDHSGIGSDKWFKDYKGSKKFHIVFIDGNHSYESTKADWLNVERILDEDCIVFFHDLSRTTQDRAYPAVARKLFEEISVEKYEKLILNTHYRLGVLYPKDNTETATWLDKNLKDLKIEVYLANPTGPPENKDGW